ncbi:MAG: hypothetical protein WAM94_04655 [Chromatiaceae bacterium]
MHHFRRTLLAALSLYLLCSPGARADSGASRQAMADAMARMMEAMGFLGSGASTANSMARGQMPGMPSPFGMPGWGMGMPGMPGMPSGGMPFSGGNQMDQAGRMGGTMMDQFSQTVPGMGQMPWSGSALDGVWEVAGGGLLIVQGGNYRLYAPDGGYVDGALQISGDRLQMANTRAGLVLQFDYALDQGRLAMRDQNGQVYLYRRLVLDGIGE